MDFLEINFTFPYPPYAIQETFMRELYRTIESKKNGIFESPTGTGKSLSICCGALQWLQDNNRKLLESLEDQACTLKMEISSKSNSDDWLQEEYANIKRKQALLEIQTKIERIKKHHVAFTEMKSRVIKQKLKSTTTEKYKVIEKNTQIDIRNAEDLEQDNDLILDDFDKLGKDNSDEENDIDNHNDLFQKIFISSRTHSQLSQFLGEIKKTIFKDIVPVITLASRQHYCINSDVNKLKNVQMINERCLDLQKSKTKPTAIDKDGRAIKKTKANSCNSCPYYNQTNIKLLKERMLVDILDMEDLVKCGSKLKACPYYASRAAMDEAQVIFISHAGIVSSGARSGNSLKLQNNILILDEAHGLTAALESAHTAPVTIKQINSVKTYLQFYINKYRSRLSSKNLLTLNQFNFVIGKLQGLIIPKDKEQNDSIYKLEDFVIKAEIDHMNLRPLIDFCRHTRLAPKLHAFSMRYNQQLIEQDTQSNKKSSLESFLSKISNKQQKEPVEDKPEINSNINHEVSNETSAGSGLYATLDFLQMLCERSENGRVLAHRGDDGLLKYLLLNPAERFAEVVDQCRSVIVAGGTMEPISEFLSLLTNNATQHDDDRVTIIRCEHVVPSENVLGICLSKGPSNLTLNYCYENRMSDSLLNETGRILRNICNIVPGGVVCFLPSYSYEKTVYDHMKKNNVIDMILKKKTVFREPKSAAEVDQVLNKFATAVKNKEGTRNGALLLSVVGGKLSEGLNFSDDLGRCVLVIGMPYPNAKSPELQEKMNYLNRTNGPTSGSVYYENLCMKAVNQCIGRAVRHANDYACVLLVDERFSRLQTTQALPSFVQKSLLSNCSFGSSIGNIAKFFSKHKQMP